MSLIKIALSSLAKRVLIGSTTGSITGAGLGYLTGKDFDENTRRKIALTYGLLGAGLGGFLAGTWGEVLGGKVRPMEIPKTNTDKMFEEMHKQEMKVIDTIKSSPVGKKLDEISRQAKEWGLV